MNYGDIESIDQFIDTGHWMLYWLIQTMYDIIPSIYVAQNRTLMTNTCTPKIQKKWYLKKSNVGATEVNSQ